MNDSVNAIVVRWKVAMMKFDLYVKHISDIKNVVADLLKKHMVTRFFDDTVKELIDPTHNALQKAVNDAVFTLLFHHEQLPDEIYIKIKNVHNSVVGHGGLEVTMSRLAQRRQVWKYMRNH